MKLMFNSESKHFLELYEPEITFCDGAEICADSQAVNYFLDEVGLTSQEVKEELKLAINKNHVAIPRDTKVKVISMGSRHEPCIFEIANTRFSAMLSYEADFCMVEVTPLNKDFEVAFASKTPPKEVDNIMLYNTNIYELIQAVDYAYNLKDSKIAYEMLKVMPEKDAISNHIMWQSYVLNNKMTMESLKK